MDAHEWLKVGSMGSQAYTFSAGVWWVWRHRNAMCFDNESWSLNWLSFNIHSMIDIFTSSFSSSPVGSSVDTLIKWNNENFSCVILNVDDSCLGSPARAGYEGIIRNNSDFYLSDFSLHEMWSVAGVFWQGSQTPGKGTLYAKGLPLGKRKPGFLIFW
jgi:hypothetical protein